LSIYFGFHAIALGDEAPAQPAPLKVAEGFTLEKVAGPPFVERPITAAFDEEGRLYVADSSGSNDPVQKQLQERPHRIVRLEDTDGDGRFDRRIVFADRMMFPAGTMFHNGSLYVSAPPSIWKLTDADGDGVAEKREEWFQGKTLTNCANDLHGPYLGPDGLIYWCKGAWDEQSHQVNGRDWKSSAAHIFRCRPDGTAFEPVMTGGMDNPVDVAFTPTGEKIFTSTFLVHPGNGERDGMGHAVYGGVHGKENNKTEGHPRTGELMPVLLHLGAAAPCGLERYDFGMWGDEYRDNLFACQFNLRKVSRHVLEPNGGTFTTHDFDFVTSENVDFHPTDVLVDADGSLLIVDTGGWYKLCCPTSQLWKPDILGGIYRVRKDGAKSPADPRGKQIAWQKLDLVKLWNLLTDERAAVRQRATRELAARRDSKEMPSFLADLAKKDGASLGKTKSVAMTEAWALGQIDTAASRAIVRGLLKHPEADVRHVALQQVSLYRDAEAAPQLNAILTNDSTMNQRLAAESLGRIGKPVAVPKLLAAAAKADDPILRHAITFALIELADADAMRSAVASDEPKARSAALIALDQMAGGGLQPSQVVPLLDSPDATLSASAHWLIARHTEWGAELAQWFRKKLADLKESKSATPEEESLEKLLATFATNSAIQDLLATAATQTDLSVSARRMVLRAMARAKPSSTPPAWFDALTALLRAPNSDLLPLTVATSRELPPAEKPRSDFDEAMLAVADNTKLPNEVRVQALAIAAARRPQIEVAEFDLLLDCFSGDRSVVLRSAAADALSTARLSSEQLARVCELTKTVSPLELHRLLGPFAYSTDEKLGLQLVAALKDAKALPALRVEVLQEKLAKYSPAVQQGIEQLHALVNVDLMVQRQRIAELLPRMSEGDVRRGHAVFHSAKASCSACHRMGYAGGIVGPDLSRIGETRTERDLLESIVFPSLSFVRSFEPVSVVTKDGRILNGLIRSETGKELLLSTGPNQEARVPRDQVDDIHPSTVSVMPAGLDKQLTVQELADLVRFLKNPTKQ